MTPPLDLSAYEPMATDIFRGRYRTSFEHAEPIKPNEPLPYVFGLPMVNHTFYRDKGSWFRCSPRCFLCTTAILSGLCPTSSRQSRKTTRRQRKGFGTLRAKRGTSACRSRSSTQRPTDSHCSTHQSLGTGLRSAAGGSCGKSVNGSV
jgi:hypothetical protein